MDSKHLLILGAKGTIGSALANHYQQQGWQLTLACRQSSEHPLASQAQVIEWDALSEDWSELSEQLAVNFPSHILYCVGSLHGAQLKVEKSIQQLEPQAMMHSFALNTLAFARLAALVRTLISRKQWLHLGVMSAKVGSISDNQLGGWYSYRASKAALNMIIKSLAVELSRLNPDNRVLAIHPGTTIGPLTQPFASNIDPNKYYSPELSASRIANILQQALNYQSGDFINWDGELLPY